MRALLEVIKFELRYQLRSPFFLGALLLFALIHFMAFTGVINLDVGALVAINSTYAVLQNELVFFILGILPVVAFVTTAITRDLEHTTAPLVYVTPISPKTFVLGRFAMNDDPYAMNYLVNSIKKEVINKLYLAARQNTQ